jgi:class 3 adenylate cyclase/tetratricopeptide (TPR) repeat protein
MDATAPAGPLSGERRVVTALFCDVVGSTGLAETLDPEDWGDLVGEAIRVMGEVVARFGGTVAEFGGDAVLAIFGAPTAHEDDPYRAVRAGMAIVERVSERAGGPGPTIEVRVGIHTGLVVAGDIAAGALHTFSALGDTLNVAARLQSLADPGCVVISGATRRLLGSDAEVHDLGLTELKGRSEPVHVYEVQRIRRTDERSRGVPGLRSPMVGRAAELTTLAGLADAARAGMGRVAAVQGEPGVGKSRLLAELDQARGQAEHTVWAVGRCSPFEEDLPYHLATSLVRSLAGVAANAPTDVVAEAVRELARRAGAEQHVPVLERLVGVPGEYVELTPEALVTAYGTAMLDLFRGLARPGELLVLVCEDIHWADASSTDLGARLIAAVPTMPVLLVLVLRPEPEAPGWRMLESARRDLGESLTELRLQPLGDEASRELLANLLQIESLPPTLRAAVADRAEGNPFFLEEVVRTLIERELVDRVDGRWVARANVGDLEVPDTIQGLLAARIDRLDPDVRRAGRVAAVIGRQFGVGVFARVYGGAEQSGVHPYLAALEAHGLLRLEATDPELRFGFRHALIHDVMYEGLLRKERRMLHHQVAEALEAEQPGRLTELAGVLARHHELAGDTEQALDYLFQAGERALGQGARVESARFYAHARDLLAQQPQPDPARMVDAVIGFVSAGLNSTPVSEATRWIEVATPLAEQLDDPDRMAALLAWDALVRGLAQAGGEEDPEYEGRLARAYRLLPRLTSTAITAQLQGARGTGLRGADDFVGSLEPLTAAADGLESVGELARASFYAAMLADSYSALGRFPEAEAAVARAADLGDVSGDPNAILDADIVRGRIAADRGDLAAGMAYTSKGVAAAEAVGNTFCTLAGRFIMGEIQLQLGEVEDAIANLETSTGLAQYCNAVGYEMLGQAWLASAHAQQGQLRREDFEQPLQRAIAMGSQRGEGLVLLQRALSGTGHGAYQEAFADYARALQCFDAIGARPLVARTEQAFGEALTAAGQVEEGQQHLRTAQQLFGELGIRS